MMELKPCPFCGGDAEFVDSYAPFEALRCANPDCYAGAVEVKHFSRDRLIESWNTRAERTCEVEAHHDYGLTYMSQRTCKMVASDEVCTCSSCGYEVEIYDGYDPWEKEYTGNYCINCGAKVVS